MPEGGFVVLKTKKTGSYIISLIRYEPEGDYWYRIMYTGAWTSGEEVDVQTPNLANAMTAKEARAEFAYIKGDFDVADALAFGGYDPETNRR